MNRITFLGMLFAPLLKPWRMLVPQPMTAVDLLTSTLSAYAPPGAGMGVTFEEVVAATATITAWPGQLR